MNSEKLVPGCEEKAAEGPGEHASETEVEAALHGLTADEHLKLHVIAKSYCRSRGFSISVLEPTELLSEAILKTLQRDKKWNKNVSIVKHLDRAMENISGHLAAKRSKIIPFPNGLSPGEEHERDFNAPPAQEELTKQESEDVLLKQVFGNDEQAKRIFVRRAEGFSVPDILTEFQLTAAQYETVARRMRRRFLKFATQFNHKLTL